MMAQMNPISNLIADAQATSGTLQDKSRNTIRASSQDTGTAGSSDGDSASISANDFLTLLVTEMKNQDPTANTDPNEYINQLVQVNSLEQLISINQTLTADSSGSPTGGVVGAAGAQQSSTNHTSTHEGGNLSVPKNNSAAQRVAGALGAQTNRL